MFIFWCRRLHFEHLGVVGRDLSFTAHRWKLCGKVLVSVQSAPFVVSDILFSAGVMQLWLGCLPHPPAICAAVTVPHSAACCVAFRLVM